jgi:hypothetical protein
LEKILIEAQLKRLKLPFSGKSLEEYENLW